jgi:hypothetical protein
MEDAASVPDLEECNSDTPLSDHGMIGRVRDTEDAFCATVCRTTGFWAKKARMLIQDCMGLRVIMLSFLGGKC